MRALVICVQAIGVAIALAGSSMAQDVPRSFSIYVDRLASADRSIRDIDAYALTIAKPLRTLDPFIFGLHGGVISARGRSIEPGDIVFSSADAVGFYTGGYLRLGPTDPALISPFVEGAVALLLMDRTFPDHPSLSGNEGRIYGKFDIRWGVDIAVQDDLQMEAAFVLNHISNGSGFGAQNINYDGIGFSLGLVKSW